MELGLRLELLAGQYFRFVNEKKKIISTAENLRALSKLLTNVEDMKLIHSVSVDLTEQQQI